LVLQTCDFGTDYACKAAVVLEVTVSPGDRRRGKSLSRRQRVRRIWMVVGVIALVVGVSGLALTLRSQPSETFSSNPSNSNTDDVSAALRAPGSPPDELVPSEDGCGDKTEASPTRLKSSDAVVRDDGGVDMLEVCSELRFRPR